MNSIPDSELIQISRGYAALLILSLIYSAIIGPRKLYYGYSLKLLAIFFLIIGIALDVPKSVWQSLGSRQMNAFEYPEGKETSFARTLYYSGFIAFSVGNLPISVPSFASEHKTSDLPIYSSTICALLTKLTFGLLGA